MRMRKHTVYSFLEVVGILFILAWLFGCANVDYEKEAHYRQNMGGKGQMYSFKLTPKR